MRPARHLLYLFGVILSAVAAAAGDWPRLLGPDGNGVSRETGLNTDWARTPPAVLWTADLHDNGYAGPSVAGGTVFLVDHVGDEDVVRAIGLDTGKDRWRFAYRAPATDGFGASRATPTHDAGRLYTLSRDGLLHCLNAADGRLLWRRDLVRDHQGRLAFYRMVASPVVDGERLLVYAGGRSGLVALHKATGALLWKSNGDPEGHATPVVTSLAGRRQYLLFTGRNLLGLSPADGRILWRFPWETGEAMNAANPLVVGKDRVLITSCDNGMALLRIDGAQVHELWRNREVRVYFGTPLVHGGLVFTKDDSQSLLCLDLASGAVLWRKPGFGTKWFDNGGLLVGGTLVVPNGRSGDLHLIAAERAAFRQLAVLRSPAGPNCLVAPIVSEGRLILRSTSKLVCLDLRRPTTASSQS